MIAWFQSKLLIHISLSSTKVKVMKQPLPRNTWKQLGPIFSRFIIYNVCHFVQFHLSKNVSTLLQIVSFSKFTQICYHSWVSLMSVVLCHGPLIVSWKTKKETPVAYTQKIWKEGRTFIGNYDYVVIIVSTLNTQFDIWLITYTKEKVHFKVAGG